MPDEERNGEGMTDEGMKDSACYHCERCIAKIPPQYPNWCAVSCEACKCDVCSSAGGEQP